MRVEVSRGKKAGITVDLDDGATIGDLKAAIQKQTRLHVHRQGLKQTQPMPAASEGEEKKGGKPKKAPVVRLDDDSKVLRDVQGVNWNSAIELKDLGPQIGYRTVFLIEYFGPLAFVLLYAARPAIIYGEAAQGAPWHPTAWLGVLCWTAHFLKRELETLFVHRFSRPTMPLFNLFKNSVYYWTFGLVIGYPLCHPLYTAPDEMHTKIGLVLFALSELGNLICHIMLRNMRPAEGSKKRDIPSGFLFNLVACPNYTFEVAGWIAFSFMTSILSSYIFTLAGFLQMTQWALDKHRRYYKSHGDEYKKLRRKAIVPFLI